MISLALILPAEVSAVELWLNTDLASTHFNSAWDYNERHKMINLEYILPTGELASIGTFVNSFDQRAYSLELGKQWSANNGTYYRASLGLTSGYDDMYVNPDMVYEDSEGNSRCIDGVMKGCKLENAAYIGKGYSILATQGIGYQYNGLKTSVMLMGIDALIWTVGFKF